MPGRESLKTEGRRRLAAAVAFPAAAKASAETSGEAGKTESATGGIRFTKYEIRNTLHARRNTSDEIRLLKLVLSEAQRLDSEDPKSQITPSITDCRLSAS